MGGTAAIETDGLSKLYPGGHGIAELTMSVPSGEVFGFLGPNGAGKTTTIRTLLGLIHPTAGSARLLGLDSRRDSVAIRRRVGNLPGDFGFGRETTGRRALDLIARLRGAETDRAAALAGRFRADLDRPLGELSRGNRQKVGLILAAFHRPDLLVLDEPTGGLDPMMQEEFLALVAEERDRGATVFLSSHELDEVERICDRVGIVRDARLIAVERVPDLLGRASRKVTARFAGAGGTTEELRRIPGVRDLEAADGTVSFHFAGDLDPVVKALAAHHVSDLEVSRPTLEEVFLGYYEGGEEGR
ncbi:MAG TPA: ABC transporter ATP-binding protein [Solirubrobacterales bacterium]|nr:ABC transporter ATP-binding protein [Solirubrobacterales bacterium]